MILKIDLSGDKALMKKLGDISDKVERKIIVDSAKIAWKPALDRARMLAPIYSGALRIALGTRMTKKKGRLTLRVSTDKKTSPYLIKHRVATFQSNGRTVTIHSAVIRDPRKYFHLVEGGTKAHTIQRGNATIQHPGTTAERFMERAFDAEKNHAVHSFTQTFIPAIEAEWRKGVKTA